MTFDIVPHIEKLLFQHDTLVIPGFGAFNARRNSAQADVVSGTLNPPSRTLSFNEEHTADDGILSAEIARHFQVSNDRAQEMIREFVADMQTLLDKREIVSLPGIGRLYRNYVQKIQFLPDSTNFSTDAYGLPALQFSPISEPQETTESVATPATAPVQAPAPVNQPYAPETNSDPSRYLPLAGLAFLLLLVVVGWILMRPRKQASTLSETQVELKQNDPEGSGATPIAQAPDKAEPEPVKEVKKPDIETASLPTPGASTPPPVKEKPSTPGKVKTAPAVSGKECIIIIGVFKDADNITQLKKKLSDNDFTLYQAPAKNGEQIGVRFNYQELADIQRNLNTLEKLTGVNDLWIKKK